LNDATGFRVMFAPSDLMSALNGPETHSLRRHGTVGKRSWFNDIDCPVDLGRFVCVCNNGGHPQRVPIESVRMRSDVCYPSSHSAVVMVTKEREALNVGYVWNVALNNHAP